MRRIVPILYAIILLMISPSVFAKDDLHITLAVHSIRKPIIEEALKQQPCDEIKEFPGTWDRVVTEFFILCQALKIGGVSPTFSFLGYPNYSRMLTEAKSGKFLMMAFAPWTKDADDTLFYISDEVLRVGEFEVGLFVLPTNKALLNVQTIDELRQFIAISNQNWVVDWGTLEHMKIYTHSVSKYDRMFKMVEAKHGDFMLNAFSSLPDMSRTVEGIKLVPIPNIKIGLKGSRRFFVHKNTPNSELIFDALQKGLKELRNQGLIRKRYEETGFYHPDVKEWKLLCCQ